MKGGVMFSIPANVICGCYMYQCLYVSNNWWQLSGQIMVSKLVSTIVVLAPYQSRLYSKLCPRSPWSFITDLPKCSGWIYFLYEPTAMLILHTTGKNVTPRLDHYQDVWKRCKYPVTAAIDVHGLTCRGIRNQNFLVLSLCYGNSTCQLFKRKLILACGL